MEIMILGMLGPVLVCEWSLDPTREALTTTVVFCGFLIGCPALGAMADVYGRKLVSDRGWGKKKRGGGSMRRVIETRVKYG